MAKPLEYNATLAERIDLTDSLSLFRVLPDEQPSEEGAWFTPGQYLVLGMNNAAQPELGSVRRAMSIASAPEDRGPLEFYIRYVAKPESDNPLTHLLWKLKAGDRMYMRMHATGKFTLRDSVGEGDPRLKILVAAGTGSAPFVSIARSEMWRDPAADLSRLVLLHGASYPADLGHRDELLGFVATNGLRYWGTVSRPQETPDWVGDVGRVEDYFRADRLEELENRLGLAPGGLTPNRAVVFVCGLNGTIARCIERLVPRGFIPDHRRIRKALEVPEDAAASLFFEQYDTTPVIDIKDASVVGPLRDQLHAALATL